MTEWGVFGVIVAVLGFLATTYKMFFQPISELNSNFNVLIEKITGMECRDAKRDENIAKNREVIIDHDKRIMLTEREIEILKEVRENNYAKGRY